MTRTESSVLLDVKGLKKYFPIRRGLLQKTIGYVKAVDDVSFFLNRGETLSLVGESDLRSVIVALRLFVIVQTSTSSAATVTAMPVPVPETSASPFFLQTIELA